QLAARQAKGEASATYEEYFRLALTANLIAQAESTAERLLKAGGVSDRVVWLAELVNIIAEADRGAYQESLDSIAAAVQAGRKPEPGQALPLPEATRHTL